jgi:predicted nucleotidyltransferase
MRFRFECLGVTMSSMSLDDRITEEIVRRVLTVSSPRRIIVFGSAAQGTMTRESDIDLLIVERHPQNSTAEYLRLRRSLRGLGFPIDLHVIADQAFEESKDLIGGIAYPAHKYGRVIYAAA